MHQRHTLVGVDGIEPPKLSHVVYSHVPLANIGHTHVGQSVPKRWCAWPAPCGLFSATDFVRCRDYRYLPALTPYDAGGTTGFVAPGGGVDPPLKVLEAPAQAAVPGLEYKKGDPLSEIAL